MPGTRDTAVKRADKIPAFLEFTFLVRDDR